MADKRPLRETEIQNDLENLLRRLKQSNHIVGKSDHLSLLSIKSHDYQLALPLHCHSYPSAEKRTSTVFLTNSLRR